MSVDRPATPSLQDTATSSLETSIRQLRHEVDELTKERDALRDMQRRFESLLRVPSFTMWEVDADGVFTMSEGGGLASLGLRPGEAVGQSVYELSRDAPAIIETVRRGLAGEQGEHDVELGGRHWRTYYTPLCDDHGNRRGLSGISFDVTERVAAETALRAERERLAAILDGTNAGTWEWNVQTGELTVNERWAAFVGYRLEELAPVSIDTWLRLSHPDDLRISENVLQRHFAGTLDSYECEARMRHKDGSWIWVLDKGKLVTRTPDGSPLLMVGTHQDVTGRKQTEQALRDSEARLREVLEHSVSVAYKRNLSANAYEYFSPVLDAILGYGPEEFSGLPLGAVLGVVHPEDVSGVKAAVLASLERPAGEPQRVEYRMRHRNGTYRWIRDQYRVVKDASGVPLSIIGGLLDITEQRAMEQEKAALEAQLGEAQKLESIGRLAGGVAHDFNNMLGVILGHAEMAVWQASLGQPVTEDLEEIQRAASRSAELTQQLLAFARRQTVSPRLLDINESVVSMLKMLSRLVGEAIVVDWEPGEGIPAVFIDPSQVDQVLANLLLNAKDAVNGAGRIRVATGWRVVDEAFCALHPDVAPGPYAWLAVSDDGCGIDDVTLPHVFEPFFTTKALGRGTGLGLATVYGIVKQNDGFVEVESQAGRGTTFTVCLPGSSDRAPAKEDAPAATQSSGRGESILVVEDEQTVLRLTTRILKGLGYRVTAAATPADALRLAGESRFDLLLTDVVMPGMNGRQLADRLVANQPRLKVLFTSGYTADIIAHHGVVEEGRNFIRKPFSVDGLAKKVRTVLEKS